jgi:hypothetical protein
VQAHRCAPHVKHRRVAIGLPFGCAACDDECENWCACVRWGELVTPYEPLKFKKCVAVDEPRGIVAGSHCKSLDSGEIRFECEPNSINFSEISFA